METVLNDMMTQGMIKAAGLFADFLPVIGFVVGFFILSGIVSFVVRISRQGRG